MNWTVERVVSFPPERRFVDGLAHLGFHSAHGRYYALSYDQHWVAEVGPDGGFLWTAGPLVVAGSPTHITVDLRNPVYASGAADGTVLVSSNGNKRVYKIFPTPRSSCLMFDGAELGMLDLGNCEQDRSGNIWVNEITGCRVLKFNAAGASLLALGEPGEPGFQRGTVGFNAVRFNWIYDLRCGPDGAIYVLDSKNYAVRRIDPLAETVTTIAGTGEPGYSGDGGPAIHATFGGDSAAEFDGPWSLAIDEANNLYVGDTHNHVVRMIDAQTGVITTIAGDPAAEPGARNAPDVTDPRRVKLPQISSLDYGLGRLFVPDWSGDLVVLRRG